MKKNLIYFFVFIAASIFYFWHYRPIHIHPERDGYTMGDFQIHWYGAEKITQLQNPYAFQNYQEFRDTYSNAPVFAYAISLLMNPKKGFEFAIKRWEHMHYVFVILIFVLLYFILKKNYPMFCSRKIFYLIPLLFTLKFFNRTLHNGQIDIFILLLFLGVLFLFLHRQKFLSGVVLGIALLIKTHMILYFCIYFLYKREFKFILGIILSFVALSFLPGLTYGFDQALIWIQQWISFLVIRSRHDTLFLNEEQSIVGLFEYVQNLIYPYIPVLHYISMALGLVYLFIFDKKLSVKLSNTESFFIGFSLCTLASLIFQMHVLKN